MDSLRKQIFVQLAIAVGVLAALLAANQFMVSLLKKTSDRIQEQRGELVFRSRASEILPILQNDAAAAKPLLEKLNKILPPKEGLINFGRQLVELAKKQKVNLTFDAKGDVPATDESPGAIKFFITGEATYANFVRFLKSVENEPFLVKFSSINMTRKPSGSSFTALADGEVFYQ